MKKLMFLFVMLIAVSSVNAEKAATLHEVNRTDQVAADKERLYIVDHTTVMVYSLTDYKLQARFGRPGEGPKEFKVRPGGRVYVYPLEDYIYVDSIGKVSIFKKNGEFVKEMRAVKGTYFEPVGHNAFVAEGNLEDGKHVYSTINIFDTNLNQGKELFRRLNIVQANTAMLYDVAIEYAASADRIFITGREGFVITAFDLAAKELFTIKREYRKRKITDQDKKDVFKWYKDDPRYDERHVARIKNMLRFPEYFPAIEDILCKDGKLYVRTFNIKNDIYEIVVFDTDGNYLDTHYIYLTRMNVLEPYDFDIANGKVYQMIEDLEKEKWNLHIFPLE